MSHQDATHSCHSGLVVNSPNTRYTKHNIVSEHIYSRNHIEKTANNILYTTPTHHRYIFKTDIHPRRTGVMIVGLCGSNATTFIGQTLANKEHMQWVGNNGQTLHANWHGSLTQCTTVRVGCTNDGVDLHLPFNRILPMLQPSSLIFGGWDIRKHNLGDAMLQNSVFEPQVAKQLYPLMSTITPLPGVYDEKFINATNKADNILPTTFSKRQQLQQVRADIRNFKKLHNLDHVVVFYSANTERSADVHHGLNMSAAELLQSLTQNDSGLSPSTIYGTAAVLEGCPFINTGSQTTVPGLMDLATRRNVFIVGDDLKSGQTKTKSALVDFLVSSGLKLESIVSYNHLGNNDGLNLSAREQKASKKLQNTSITDDMSAMNGILYPKRSNNPTSSSTIKTSTSTSSTPSTPSSTTSTASTTPPQQQQRSKYIDHHTIVRYVPHVGDEKRGMEEYISSIGMNAPHRMVIFTTAADSLLAAPLLLDLTVLVELLGRIRISTGNASWQTVSPLLGSLLGYFLKAPVVSPSTPITHAVMKQQRFLTNFLCLCAGLVVDSDLRLEHIAGLPKPIPITAML